jgi:hypothetical protein
MYHFSQWTFGDFTTQALRDDLRMVQIGFGQQHRKFFTTDPSEHVARSLAFGAFAIERNQKHYGALLAAAILLTFIPLPGTGDWPDRRPMRFQAEAEVIHTLIQKG